jgi:hypothetical protein
MTTAFKTISSKNEIMHVQRDIVDKKTLKYAPVSVLVGDEFKAGSTLQFRYTNANSWIDPSDSYMNIKLKISQNDGTALAGDDIALNFNPGACLFSKSSYEMEDKVVSNVNHVAQTESFFYRTQTSKLYRNTLGSAQWVDDLGDNTEGRLYRTQSATVHEIAYIPVSLSPFSSNNQLLPPGITHSLKFDIASDWELKVIEAVDGLAKTIPTPNTNVNAANQFKIEIQDIQLHVVHYLGPNAPSGDIYFDYKNVIASYKNLNGSENQIHQITIPPNVYRGSLAFQKNAINSTLNNVNKFTSENEIEKKIKSFLLHIGSRNFPNVAPIIRNEATQQIGLNKLWKDTQSALNHQYSFTGYEAYKDWLASPYYSLALPRDASELASEMDIDLTLDASTAGHLTESVVWMFAETTSVVSLRYSGGKPEVALTEAGNVVA